MKTVSAVGFPDFLQPEFLRFLFCPAQHGSLPIDSKKREPEQPDEAVPALPSSAVVTLNLGKMFRLDNMSGRSLAALITAGMRIWPLSSWLAPSLAPFPPTASAAPHPPLPPPATLATKIPPTPNTGLVQTPLATPPD